MQDKRGRQSIHQNDQHSAVGTLAHTVHAGCAKVLPGVGRHSRADAFQRDGQQVLRFAGSGDGGHGGTAQHIDSPLHDNAADCRDAALQTHGNANAHQPHTGFFAEHKVVLLHLEDIKLAAEVDKAQYAGNDLGNVGR